MVVSQGNRTHYMSPGESLGNFEGTSTRAIEPVRVADRSNPWYYRRYGLTDCGPISSSEGLEACRMYHSPAITHNGIESKACFADVDAAMVDDLPDEGDIGEYTSASGALLLKLWKRPEILGAREAQLGHWNQGSIVSGV